MLIRNALRYGGGFDPLSLSPEIWIDASDISTLFQDSAGTTPVTAAADPIGKLSDKSGDARHFVQATSSFRPSFRITGGKNGINPDGVDDFVKTAAGQVWPASVDMFIVMSNGEADGSWVLFSPSEGGGDFGAVGTDGSGTTDPGGPDTIYVNDIAQVTRNDLHDNTVGGALKLLEKRAVSISGYGAMVLGLYPGFAFGGQYHEILIYPELTAGQRTTVRNYLIAKWGVA